MWSQYSLFLCVGIALVNVVHATATGAPTVTVKNGSYSGVYDAVYEQEYFLGVPYAQKAVRYTLPQSVNETWSETRAATTYPPHCVGYGGDDVGYAVSEDCLYLNVVRPTGVCEDAELPVGFWIHGGGLYMGGSADKRYNLSFIVENSVKMGTPMIGVSINYRLSGFGFLGGQEVLSAGVPNLGFRDQRLALRWVHENIASFGGDPEKVTIWGESAGGQSVGIHLLAYNGRDDKLFRGAIAQSGGPGTQFFVGTMPGLYNSSLIQKNYETLVGKTSCAATINSTSSLDCLRSIPFSELNAALNSSASGFGPWAPMIDNDLIARHPSIQLARGDFVKVPLIIGANTDEGSAFGSGYGPNGTVNTDDDFAFGINKTLPKTVESSSGKAVSELIDTVAALYPNIQAIGIPSLDSFPEILTPTSGYAIALGLQYRRISAYIGDLVIHAPRRKAALAWSTANTPVFSYRFDVTVNGVPNFISATHFQEVAFVFGNTNGLGYATDPFANQSQAVFDLANTMCTSWVNFIATGDPNGAAGLGSGIEWPVFNATADGGAGQGIVWTAKELSHAEPDTFRAEGMKWINDHVLSVYGR